MTNQQHPITPPPELVEQWIERCLTSRQFATMAFQAGADQELEACCKWLCAVERWKTVAALRAAADQVAPSDGSRRTRETRAELLAIAAELEGAQ